MYFARAFKTKQLIEMSKVFEILLRYYDLKIDTLMGMGNSGVYPLSTFCSALNLNPAICRKKTDNSHSGFMIESLTDDFTNWGIIDDFISSGQTISNIIERVYLECEKMGYNYSPPKVILTYTGERGFSAFCLNHKNHFRVKLPIISISDANTINIANLPPLIHPDFSAAIHFYEDPTVQCFTHPLIDNLSNL